MRFTREEVHAALLTAGETTPTDLARIMKIPNAAAVGSAKMCPHLKRLVEEGRAKVVSRGVYKGLKRAAKK